MGGFDLVIQPDDEDAEAAAVLVDGTVGGRPYRFLLDTGAAVSSVGFDDYTSTFERVGMNSSSGVFDRRGEDMITVPHIQLGPIAKSNFTLVRAANAGPDARNLIGMDLLKDYCCHFRFDEQRVIVDPTDVDEHSERYHELMLGNRFHTYVGVRLGAMDARAVWDSGAGITVVDVGLIERHPAYFQEVGQSQGTDSTGAQMPTAMFVMSGAVIGGRAFSPHRVAAVDLSHVNAATELPMDLILGYSTLSQANWLLDFPRRRWAISKMLSGT